MSIQPYPKRIESCSKLQEWRDVQQLRLPCIDPTQQVRAAADRTDPLIWVRRIQVRHELQPGDEHVVRDVELRRGLNIVWAPPEHLLDGNDLFRSGVAGHTAGKTTFCRLLRYALGEGAFATEAARRRIREKLPTGWLLAELYINGRRWAVARPFGIGHHPFCVEGGGVRELISGAERTDFRTFLDAVESATTAHLPAGQFPTRQESVGWAHILPWLTRDQECRFADFLEWRHSSSDSDAPALNVDERQFVVRSVLSLITDEERDEQKRNAELVAAKNEATQKEPLLAHQAAIDHERVQRLLKMDIAPPSSGLFGSQARAELERREAELSKAMEELAGGDKRADLRTALEHSVEAETIARRDVEDTEARLAMERSTVQELASHAKGDAQISVLDSLPPPRDYCNVPVALARERGCPLVVTRPVDLAERRSERSAAEELEDRKEIVRALEESARAKEHALKEAEGSTKTARHAFLTAATTYDEQIGKLLEQQARLRQAQRFVDEAEAAWIDSTEQATRIQQLADDIRASYVRQEEFRRIGRQALGDFSATFDYVLRALLGEEVEGRVETSGRGLNLIVEHRGERDSAALSTLKLLAFDLAAITESIQGRGHFPRLLVHDGPREADMAPDIYERIFLYVRRLEECFSDEPSFQYIVTTTTQPPDDFLDEPWMRLKLAGAPAEERLLRMDL